MPRGNPNVWKKHGSSYAELAGTTTSIERAQDVAPRRLPPVSPATIAEAQASKPAGTPSIRPHKGTGSFVLQNTWSLGTAPQDPTLARSDGAGLGPSSSAGTTSRWVTVSAAAGNALMTTGHSKRSYTTETKSNLGPPPPDFRRTHSAGPKPDTFPVPTHPNDWKTMKQMDFRPELVAGAGPPPAPFRKISSGNVLLTDVPLGSQFKTQHRTQFTGRSAAEGQSLRPSGCSATQTSGYNIITGALSYANNAFEHWDGRDYRRHR